jgi:hypothetical protein
VAKGSAKDLSDNTIWLFDHVGSIYHIDIQAIVDPSAQTWSAPDRPLGSASDRLPFNLTSVVVIASPQCTYDLQADVDADNTSMPNLPPGCNVTNPPITVTVDSE